MNERQTPSFRLPACPICSNLETVERPFWRLARHYSKAKGSKLFIFVGCEHAAELIPPFKIHEDEDEIRAIEDAWAHHADQLFAAKVDGWRPKAVDDFRRRLNDSLPIKPGETAPLPFGYL